MGILDLLFGRRKNIEAATPPELPEKDPFEDQFLTLSKPRWFGTCRRSPNSRWVISWREGGSVVSSDGAVSRSKGAYLLYEAATGRVALRGNLLRPMEGTVAENGTFALSEMGFSNALESVLHVFNADGERLLKRKLHALVLTTAISKNGRYAVCTTGNSGHEDGGSLFLFDLQTGTQLFATPPSAGWSTNYYIDEDRIEVIARIKELGEFRYDQTGQFLDDVALEETILQRGDYSRTIMAAERILLHSEPSIERVRQVLTAVQRARNNGADMDNGWRAAALKVQGLAHEALGEAPQAIKVYEQALALNPKIGVKRRLTVDCCRFRGHRV